MRYPAIFARDKNCVVVTFRDVPEAIAQGKDNTEALVMAQDVLLLAIQDYLDGGRVFPKASKPIEGEVMVELRLSVSAKVLLLNELRQQNVRPAELARRLRVAPQEATRLTNLKHPTHVDTIARAMGVLGRRLEIQVE